MTCLLVKISAAAPELVGKSCADFTFFVSTMI
jgi:hypothetical protein